MTQERKHYGQHASNDGKVCQQLGRAGGTEDTAIHGREEESRHASVQHDASVSSYASTLYLGLLIITRGSG